MVLGSAHDPRVGVRAHRQRICGLANRKTKMLKNAWPDEAGNCRNPDVRNSMTGQANVSPKLEKNHMA